MGLYTLLFCVARVVFNFYKTICVNIYVYLSFTKKKKKQRKYVDTLDVSKITDNKTFWKNILSLFLEKRKFTNKITLKDREEDVISDYT